MPENKPLNFKHMKMKALYFFSLFCALVVFSNCNRDQDLAGSPEETLNEAQAWKPSEGMSPFLESETRARIPAEDLEFVDRILKNPNADILRSRGAEVHIPAGSVNALPGAIAAASAGDVIILDAGDHMEMGNILINKPVTLMGEKGTNLIFSGVPPGAPPGGNFIPAIHLIQGAEGSVIRNIRFTSSDPLPGACIFVDSIERVKVLQNVFESWIFSVVGYAANRLIITQNKITVGPVGAHGIVLSDGDRNVVVLNEIINAVFGIFTGGTNGISFSNNTHHCVYGQVLCKVPPGDIVINNRVLNTKAPTINWSVKYNNASNNQAAGYLVIDGSYNNFLLHNNGSGNGAYDIELTSDTERFGFLAPASHHNRVIAFHWLRVKDCGVNNQVIGGMLVNNAVDPCN